MTLIDVFLISIILKMSDIAGYALSSYGNCCDCDDIECDDHEYDYYIPTANDRLEGARYDPLNPMRNLVKKWHNSANYAIETFNYWTTCNLMYELPLSLRIEIVIRSIEKNPGIAKYITNLPSVFFIYDTPKIEKINIYKDYDLKIEYGFAATSSYN